MYAHPALDVDAERGAHDLVDPQWGDLCSCQREHELDQLGVGGHCDPGGRGLRDLGVQIRLTDARTVQQQPERIGDRSEAAGVPLVGP